jgi:NAD(P)-dependent dehydrogenase (short-subunit alcohol dehydrogenase family)
MEHQTIAQTFDLGGKVAIVTGGARMIGRGVALRLAEAGAAVMIVDVNHAGAEETCNMIAVSGGVAKAIQADVGIFSDARRSVQAAVEAFGRLDFLINNAAIFPAGNALEETEEQWDKVMDVDLKGSFFFAQEAARQMIREGHGGKIVNFSSASAVIPADPPFGPKVTYDTAKGGIISMTRSLAKNLGEFGVHVNCIQPGPFLSEEFEKMAPEMFGKIIGHTVLKRIGRPQDIGNVVLFLCSSASDYITGVTIPVDGGFLLY